MADEKLIALEVIEYPSRDGKSTKRLAAGDAIPDTFPQGDLPSLKKHGAIGSQEDFEAKVAKAEDEAAKARAIGAATAAGLTVVDGDSASGADRQR